MKVAYLPIRSFRRLRDSGPVPGNYGTGPFAPGEAGAVSA